MSAARFNDFFEMKARRDSVGCINGAEHPIAKGDFIGWSPRYRVACCSECWASWSYENAEADLLEQTYRSWR